MATQNNRELLPEMRSAFDVGSMGVVSGRGFACVDHEGGNGYAGLIAEVDVNLETGVVRPKRFVIALDCGPVPNLDGV